MDHVAVIPSQHCLVGGLILAAIVGVILLVGGILLEVRWTGHLVQAALHVLAWDAPDLVSLRVEVVWHLDFTLSSIVVDLVLGYTVMLRNPCALVGGGMLVRSFGSREGFSCARITRQELALPMREGFSALKLPWISLRNRSAHHLILKRRRHRSKVLRLSRTTSLR